MLALFRSFMNTWLARALLIVLVASFGAWGIAGVFTGGGPGGTDVATVGGRTVTAQDLQDAYRGELAQAGRMFGDPSQIPPPMRRGIAQQALDRLLVQAAVLAEVARMRLAVPDTAVRDAVFAIPAFQNPQGQFERARLEQFLSRAGMGEPRFLQLMREDISQRELIESLKAGVAAPAGLAARLFAYEGQTRIASEVELPFAAVKQPPAPDAAVLQRWYDNNPDSYRTPELRRVKAVILSPDTVARGLTVTDAALRAAYAAHAAEYHVPEKRSAEVLTLPDQARAAALAQQWRTGASWEAVQKAAGEAGGTAVALSDAAPDELPSPELAKAVFAAPQGSITGPVQGPFGWVVLAVTGVTPAVDRDFDSVQGELRTTLAREQAAGLMDGKVQALQDALAGGGTLDELPADLGAAAVEGTLDAQGNTQDGEPAPIPAPPALRAQLIAQAFRTPANQPPSVANGPDQSFFALQVESITPPRPKPYAEVADQVLADWRANQVRHVQDAAAAKVLTAVQHGQSLTDAATVAGLHVARTPAIGRGQPPAGVSAELARILFGLKQGEATMVEGPDGFTVAVLDGITSPDPASDPPALRQMRDQLSRATGDDAEAIYAAALRDRDRPRVNAQAVDAVLQQ